MDPGLATLSQRMQHRPGRSRAQKTLPDEAGAEALVVEEQGGLACLQVRAVLPWSQALEILRLLADAQAGTDRNGAPH
jgi:hypothetical protein